MYHINVYMPLTSFFYAQLPCYNLYRKEWYL
nr:MAG TPA: hypothetical protein [Caudoviricetes sp.]